MLGRHDIAALGACLSILALPAAAADAVMEINTGADFNAGPGNPCDEQGNGAIPDSAPATQKSLKEAVAKAKQALAEQDFEKGKAYAAEAQLILSK